MTIGILAYGSLIPNPGAEIAAVTVDRITGVETPFRVEFSRSSRVRDGAPTLVPVDKGGGRVSAVVIVLRESVTETAAQDMLYRRERNRVGSGEIYADVDQTNIDSAFLGRLDHFAGLDVVFHAALKGEHRGADARDAGTSGHRQRRGALRSGRTGWHQLPQGRKRQRHRHTAYGRLRTGDSPSDRRPRPRGSPCHRPRDIVLAAPAHSPAARQFVSLIRRDIRRPVEITRQIALDRVTPQRR